MSTALAQHDFDYVRAFVQDRSAVVIHDNKGYLVESRLGPVARRHGFPSLAALVAQLRGGPSPRLEAEVIEAMTTHETSFFRDRHPFEALREHIVPTLVERRAGQRVLNIWCAGCSSGQEPYSVAMLLRDEFPALAAWRVRILASDLSRPVLDRAKAASYTGLEVGRGLPTAVRERHFDRDGAHWRLNDHIRRMVEFRAFNLAERWPPLPDIDLLMMRNVLIYFDVETKRRILAWVREVLRPGGCLLLGAPETTLNIDPGFTRHLVGQTTWYQVR